MTTTRASSRPLDGFEQALLTELRHHVAVRSAASAPARPPRRRIAALTAAAVAACSVAVGAVVLRPDPAFAVEQEADGDVVVTIASLRDADGLERALAAEGVEADVSYDADHQFEMVPAPEGSARERSGEGRSSVEPVPGPDGVGTSAEPAAPGPSGELPCSAIAVRMDGDRITFRLPAEAVDSDSVLRIQTAGSGAASWGSVAVQWEEPVC